MMTINYMKKLFTNSSENLKLFSVFLPVIIFLSSWTAIETSYYIDVASRLVHQINEIPKSSRNTANLRSPISSGIVSNKIVEGFAEEDKGTDVLKTNTNSLITRSVSAKKSDAKPAYDSNTLARAGFIGIIGNIDSDMRDASAADNIFEVELSSVNPEKSYTLTYDVDGYADINSVTRSINGSYAMGGYVKKKNNGWSEVSEKLDPALLRTGENRILFNAIDKGYYYTVKNVRITEVKTSSPEVTFVSQVNTAKVIYVRGFLKNNSGVHSIEINGEQISLKGNEFEYFSDKTNSKGETFLKFSPKGNLKNIEIPRTNDISYLIASSDSYDKLDHNALLADKSMAVFGLRYIDLPPVDLSITNISKEYEGFRIHNLNSSENTFQLSYDEKKLPKGYKEKDISVFSFDYDKKRWMPAKIDSVNVEKKYVVLKSLSEKVDFIVGITMQPESPDNGGGAQTAFNDTPVANPSSKINMIAPPKPNQQGSANISYPIEIPAGVGGFQPNVSLVYNSDNKFGWAGTGWDIPYETIDIDTRWGVPSFGSHETEIYMISGEQLVFRDDYLPNKVPLNEARTPDRQFFYRNGIKEGYLITRKGNSPSTYYWEILDGSGTKKEYYDMLTTASSGNSSGNIVRWYLSKVTDRFGNTINYTYADSYDSGGKNKYLSRISYSNNTAVEFESEAGVRGDMTFNYKMGVKITDSKILSKITVKRANTKIREYQLVNTVVGMFSKRLLTEIIQKDGSGNFFNKYVLKYDTGHQVFDNTATKVYSTPQDNSNVGSFSGGNTSFIAGTYSKNKNFRGAVSFGGGACFLFGINKKGTIGVTGSLDDNHAYGKNQLIDIDGDGLLDKVFYGSNNNINFRKNLRTGFSGVYGSVGLAGVPISRHNMYNTTIGLEYSFSNGVVGANVSTGKSNSPTYFSDVNGDGLVDMINYGEVHFGKIRNGLPQFQSQPQGSSVNVTEETPNAILAGHGAVQDTITTTTTATSLANIVRMWEAPVEGDIHISNEITLNQNSTDGIDVWIEKGEMIKANEDVAAYNPANSTVISSIVTLVSQNQFQGLSATTHVRKGQRIFIVASSKNNEDGDRIRIDNDIRYTSITGGGNLDIKDANNNFYYKFNARSHYLASSQKHNAVGDKSKVSISWDRLDSQMFTDDVDFKIYKSVRSVSDTTGVLIPASTTLIYHQRLLKGNDQVSISPGMNEIPNSDISDLLVNQNLSDPTVTMFHFDVSSDTNVSWEKIRWKPWIVISSDTDTTEVKARVQYNPYSERLINTVYKNFEKYRDREFCDGKVDCPRCNMMGPAVVVFPDFNGDSSTANPHNIGLSTNHNTKVTFSLKIKDDNGNVFTAKNTVDVVNNVMAIPKIDICTFFSTIPIPYQQLVLLPFYFEISSPDYEVAKKLSANNPYILNSAFITDPLMANTGSKADYFGYRSGNTHYNLTTGLVYQGWGAFSYNGSKYTGQSIREAEFNANPFANVPAPGGASPCNPSAPDYYTCLTNYIMQQNSNRYFTPLDLDAELYAYVSPMEPVEIGEYEMQSYLLGVSSTSSTITTTPIFAVPNPRGIIFRSKSESVHAYVNGSIIPWLGISAHGGISTEKTSDYFQDFNGDRYPDIISGSLYQKTNILGQLDQVSSTWEKEIKNKGTIIGAGIGASASIAKFTNTDNKFFSVGAEKDSQAGSSSFALGVGVSVNIGKAWANGSGVWADMNGDGLTDYVSDGNVYINTGNDFVTDNNSWNVSNISSGDSFAVSGGGGFSFANGSWAGGVGLSKSKSTATTGLIDVNGDGMADKIVKVGNTYEMWINDGRSFVPPQNFNKNFSLDSKQNSAGFNFYGTICACFGLKMCISGGASTDNSVSKQEVDLRDFDGDGYPDLLISENDNSLTYYSNNFSKANLLISFESSLQGTIELEYDNKNEKNNFATLIGTTYQMPFSKRVLSRVLVRNFNWIDTTMPSDGEVPNSPPIKPAQTYAFEYEKGIQDRREREFLGFGIVKSKIYNDQTLHQTMVTHYETDFTGNEGNFFVRYNDSKVRQYFYKKGLVRSTYLLDNQNRKRNETRYYYRYFDVPSSSGYQLTESQAEPLYDDIGRIIPLLYKTEKTFTEYTGSGQHSKTTINTVDSYDKYGNVKQATDRGASITNTTDDVKTVISYHAPGSKNIVGIPSEQSVITVHNNEIMRKSTTVLDANQNIKQIKKDPLGTSTIAGTSDFDMEYDSYGNMTKITYPVSENGQRMFYIYNYDPVYHTYLISTTDAYGFSSTTQYDNNYLLGVPKSITNINGQISQYTYDSFGRLISYLAPTDDNWTVKLHYYPFNVVPVAITERKAVNSDSNVNYFTSLFTDTWGEGMMIKKLIKKENQTYSFTNNVYQLKDRLGRPVKTILRDKITTGTDIMTSLKTFDEYSTADDQTAQIYSTTQYDNLDRPISITQNNVITNNGTQNLTSQIFYGFDDDRYGHTQFSTKTVSPLGITNVTYTDEFGRTTSTRQTNGTDDIWVGYRYNRLNELTTMEDAGNHPTQYKYDKLGRSIEKKSPDTGDSGYKYDLSGKLIASYNANLKATNEEVFYIYNFDQLTEVNYPNHSVKYTYGQNLNEEKGRLIKQSDRTGTESYKYDFLGNINETMRIVVAPNNVPKMFKTFYTYDIYGRITKMLYPDTEEVTYNYDMRGLLNNIQSKLPGETKPKNIAYDMIYNNRDQLTSYRAGNGTKTQYDYDTWGNVKELSLLKAIDNTNIRKNKYTFDGNGNLSDVAGTTPMSGNFPSMDLGIATNKHYNYDLFGRLNSAQITAKGKHFTKHYELNMGYNPVGDILSKDSKVKTYNNNVACQYPQNEGDLGEYEYSSPSHPNAVSAINYTKNADFISPLDCQAVAPAYPVTNTLEGFGYDYSGNMIVSKETESGNLVNFRQLLWDHENRLKAVATNHKNLSYYVYDAGGDRILKNDAVTIDFSVNGNSNQQLTQMGSFVYYPNGYMVLNVDNMSKHYYMGSQRIATRVSKVPTHRFKIDVADEYAELAQLLDDEVKDIIKNTDLPPAEWPSTEDSQGTYTPPSSSTQNNNLCAVFIEQQMYIFQQSGNKKCYSKLSKLYVQALQNNANLCDVWNMFLQDECMSEYTPPESVKSEMYWIHPDHFSGASILVNSGGTVTNWYEYMPYGEMLMENTTFSYDNPNKYNAKEYDMATGYYFYGARYYDPKRSFWLSVDPLSEITNSPYAYVWNDPVNFADPTGLRGERVGGDRNGPKGWGFKDGKWTYVAGMQKGDAAYKKGGYTDFAADNSVIEKGSINGGSFAPVYLGSSQNDVSYAERTYTEWSSINGSNYDNPLDGYRAWQSNPGYHKGEDFWDRTFRVMAYSSMEARRDFSSGGNHATDLIEFVVKAQETVDDTQSKIKSAELGYSKTLNYKSTFFNAFPELEGEVIVHHAIEQQVLKRYPAVILPQEMHSLENLRGIPKSINNDVHLSQIRKIWNKFYKKYPNPSKQQLLDQATIIDQKFGSQFSPPLK
ncbi:RHS repeat-associated core domain-containing protein [Chryseobacterium piscicola]|nr:RHS repeat-associated core domain-containing protein [Chryseobacterium piscicola]